MESTFDPYQYRQLFLDDFVIENIKDVTRTLHQPIFENYVIKPDQSRNQIAVQSNSTPQWNPEKNIWEWWYRASYEVPEHGSYASRDIEISHYATSVDGLNWDFPNINKFVWQDDQRNNIASNPGGRFLHHVVRDERDRDSHKRYKALFDVQNRYPAWSPDGFSWTFSSAPSIPSYDTSSLFYDDFNNQWVATVKHGTEWGRSVWLVTSKDFVHWTDPRLILHTDEIDRQNRKQRLERVINDPTYLTPPLYDGVDYVAELYKMPVLPYEGLYIGFPLIFNPAGAIPPPRMNFTGINQTELAVSRNLINWDRVADRAMFLEVQPWDGHSYATAQVIVSGRPIIRNNEIWIYHGAYRFRSWQDIQTDVDASFFKDRSALALSKLRLDGFVSLDGTGEIITKPFEAKGGTVHINAVATSGQIRTELIDATTMDPVPNLGCEESVDFTTDNINAMIPWSYATLPTHGQYRLRFVLKNASIYSFWTEE